uniref:RNA helicase n=1 Tax=Arion vulgaris TaxID=1028688 RepID=A0A0B7AQ95_9EUPU
MSKKDRAKLERGPKLHEPVCIGESVKIGIHLAIERFRLDSSQTELPFPTSLSTTERAYIHRYCNQLGNLKASSRGSGQNRCITVRKTAGGKTFKTLPSYFSFVHSATQVNAVLSKYPVTAKEKQDLTPLVVKSANTNESRDKSNFGRLTTVVPQVPLKRGNSELNKFRESLPVYQMGIAIVEGINTNKVVLIAGETGSGKTTQVPQLIIDDCYDRKEPCRILCTQPRRIAAVSIAERVAAERGERIGHVVGYQIRLESKISPKTVLTFCTTGVLLRTLMGGDACLSNVTHVIVDEVHERDRFTDFLLLCLKEALPHHQNLRVILMSATLNMTLFSEYFDGCPVVCVPGNLYHVDELFLEDILKWTAYKNKDMDNAMLKTQKSKGQVECLSEWCSKQLNIAESAIGSGTEEDSDVTTSDNAELGEEKEELEPWVIEEMDRRLKEVWLTGSEESFHQILYLISSENVSVDYVQSETSTTPLMIAAARGFINVVEHLLSLGADASIRTSNNWTALDFAKKFNKIDILELLEAHLSSLESGHVEVGEDLQLVSEEDRELLSAYQQSFDDEKVDISLVTCLINHIQTMEREGAILVFLPGYDDIMNLKAAITDDRRFPQGKLVIYTLHSSLQYSDQKRVFKPPPQGIRKIILSTNIAETSITINDVVFVIDCGKVKEKTYDALTSLTMLKSNWISKASALQRKGRAGRCQSGKCYHLFSRSRYMHLQDYQTPEILRLPLQELCLHTKLLAPVSQSIETFLSKCPQAPPQLIIRNAIHNLKQIDALDPFEDMTELGQHLSDLPIEPRLGKIILYSVVLKCLDPVLTIVSTLSYKDPCMYILFYLV